MPSTVFITEASEYVGYGHLTECINLAKELKSKTWFLINENPHAINFLSKTLFEYSVYRETGEIQRLIGERGFSIAVVDLRSVFLELLEYIKNVGLKNVVIDELGGKPIIADVLINGSVIKSWHTYEFPEKKPKTCFGPEYIILGKDYSKLHAKKKNRTRKILISMGGADRTGKTEKIVKSLKDTLKIKKDVIIGPGFENKRRLFQIQKETDQSFNFIFDAKDLSKFIFESDVVFTAGGNTLCEAACLGTPAIVLWEDPHEKEMGNWFTERGAAINIGQGVKVNEEDIKETLLSILNDEVKWKRMSRNGKKLVDGRGTERIVAVIKSLTR